MSTKHTRRTRTRFIPRKFSHQHLQYVLSLSDDDIWDLCCDEVKLRDRMSSEVKR
jgi:hypothetical protein